LQDRFKAAKRFQQPCDGLCPNSGS